MIRRLVFVEALVASLFLVRHPAGAQEPKPAEEPAPAAAEKAGAPPQAAPPLPSADPRFPAGVIARVNGRDITVDEYAGYLLASIGKSRLDEYVDRLLLDAEAKSLGVAVTPEEVEASVEERVDRTIKGLYKGNKEAYASNLERRRSSVEEEKARLRQERYYEILREKVILKTREVGEEDIRREFERVHGEGGVRYTLRHILVSTRPASARPEDGAAGDDASKTAPEPPRTKAESRERAEKVLAEIRGGLDFVQAVKQYSDDHFTKKNDGRIPTYRKGAFGNDFHAAVESLTPESPVSGVVESPRGFHIIQLVEKIQTKLEDVRGEIEKIAKTQPPSPRERLGLTSRLRDKAKLEGL
jgi:parvulin-like peptidyl-prolyl isomerase